MARYSGGTASMLAAPVQGNLPSIYRDSIRRVSVSGGLCWPAQQFFPSSTSSDTASTGEGGYFASRASSASGSSFDASARSSSVSLSFSDGELFFSGGEVVAADEVQDLRAIAQRMFDDGYVKGLIRAFGSGCSRSASYGGLGPRPEDLLLRLGSWFSALDVEWVLHTGEGGGMLQLHLQNGCASLQELMERWIKALKTMVHVLCITQQELRAKKPTVGGFKEAVRYFMLAATGREAELEQEVVQFVRFAAASILSMLDFVDAVSAAALNDDQAPETLPGMLQVYTCVLDDSAAVLALFREACSITSISMFDDMTHVFLRKREKLSGAIWSMMEKVRASFLIDNCWRFSPEFPVGSVHKTTELMMNYIMLLSRNEGALNFVLQDQQHCFRMLLPGPNDSSSMVNLIKDLIACLEKQLEKTSNFISDSGLRFIFLMNNCSFISKKLSSLLLTSCTLMDDYPIKRPKNRDSRRRLPPMEDYVNKPDPNLRSQIEKDSDLDGLIKIQRFIEAYLDASWEPVMSCLCHDIPRHFLRGGGALDKFEAEFQRTYATQKLWKVPNPELRKRLRKAVIEKVISGYSKYLVERTATRKSNRPPNNTPRIGGAAGRAVRRMITCVRLVMKN